MNEKNSPPIWILMPIAGAPDLTPAAIADVLDQSVPTRLLLIGQGIDRPFRESLERIAEADPERIFLWCWDPPLPSLSAAWNHGLNFAWKDGAEEALVINNDVRLHPRTVELLQNARRATEALFVSAIGVREEQFDPTLDTVALATALGIIKARRDETTFQPLKDVPKGGPDFSCFLISRAGHEKYPFDEAFIPAYCEDLDTHRRYMLGGDGSRIFSINLPYLHYASGTLKGLDPEARAKKEQAIAGSRRYYARKWGGPVNAERFRIPFDHTSDDPNVTTPSLQQQQRLAEATGMPVTVTGHPGASGPDDPIFLRCQAEKHDWYEEYDLRDAMRHFGCRTCGYGAGYAGTSAEVSQP